MIDRFTAFAYDPSNMEDAWHPEPLAGHTMNGTSTAESTLVTIVTRPVRSTELDARNVSTTAPSWPRYDPADSGGAYLEFDTPQIVVKYDLIKERCDFWDEQRQLSGVIKSSSMQDHLTDSGGYDF